jgi:hypothetical protein
MLRELNEARQGPLYCFPCDSKNADGSVPVLL